MHVQLKAHGSCKTYPTSQILMWKSFLLHGKKKIYWIYRGEITTKKMQDTEHCPESKKSYKVKQGKLFRYAFL